MGEVDQLDDAVDHRVTQRNESEHRAVGKAEDEDLRELGGPGDGLDREKDDHKSAEDEENEVREAHSGESSGPHSLERRNPGF